MLQQALTAAREWADGNDKLNPSDSPRRRSASTLTAPPMTTNVTPTPTFGRRRRINTQARVQSAVRAAKAAGLAVRRITIAADGSITIDSTEDTEGITASPDKAASWDDA